MKRKNKQSTLRKWQKPALCLCVFTVVLLCLYLMMVLFATIPNEAIRKNMTRSARAELTQDRYELPEDGSFRGMADHYADQVWLNIAWHMGEGDPFTSVLDTKYYDGGSFGAAAGLHQTVTRGHPANTGYTRYWHGSAAVLRFLHIFLDIRGIRTLGILCIFLLAALTVGALWKRGHRDLGICLIAALLTVHVWQLRLSVEYMPCFLLCFGLCPLYLRLEKQGDFPLELLAVATGTMTAFFDFLTTETVTILLPLILVVAVRSGERRLVNKQATAKMLLGCLLCWGFGYVGAFAVKWIAAAQVTHGGDVGAAMESAMQRLGGKVLINGVEKKPGMLMSIGANLSVLFGGVDRRGYGKIFSGLVLWALLIYVLVREYRTRKNVSRGTGFILSLGAVVLLRYGVLANHSYLHAFFTYRALVSTVFGVLAVLALNLRPRKKRRRV